MRRRRSRGGCPAGPLLPTYPPALRRGCHPQPARKQLDFSQAAAWHYSGLVVDIGWSDRLCRSRLNPRHEGPLCTHRSPNRLLPGGDWRAVRLAEEIGTGVTIDLDFESLPAAEAFLARLRELWRAVRSLVR